MNVYEHIAKAVVERVDEIAIVERDKQGNDTVLTYADYDAQVKRLCAALAQRGVGEGDRVIPKVLLRN